MSRRLIISTYLLASLLVTFIIAATPAFAIDNEHYITADHAIDRGIAYLRATQNDDGSWSPQPGPAVTAMVVRVMLEQPQISSEDPAVAHAIDYILSKTHDDGSIHDGILENYNTSICLSALAMVHNRPDAAIAVRNGQAFLRQLQWDGQIDPTGNVVNPQHSYYGGAGYGNHGRPDMSNTQIMIQALHDTGLDCNDTAYQRALVFIQRCQGIPSNTQYAHQINQDGGFIYATSVNQDHIGVPVSYASPEQINEAKAGRPVSGLRGYGSVTYAGFKSYLYAGLTRDDPRVVAAYNWIRNNYTLTQNPGMPFDTETNSHLQGLYYYYMTMARALDAWGGTTITTPDGINHDWANDLIAQLTTQQDTDGSWINIHKRWMENDRNLVTAYALIALIHAMD